MSLAKYRQKRDFSKTTEPAGKARRKAGRSYVIQKHDASKLHYDLRLELDGVLLSWAVPKGPSLDPSVKRLAMQTEDHPLEYGGFEGTIPEGEYGGGTVMVWDRGSWEPDGDARRAYEKGHLSFQLYGQKLTGGWHLVKTQRPGQKQNSWLLFKAKDEAAKPGDTALLERNAESASTGRDLETIAAGQPNKRGKRSKPSNWEQPRVAAARAVAKRPGRSAASKSPLSHPDKVLYPELGLTKRELAAYYELVSDLMLPHVVNRPLTLLRCPDGRQKQCFFQKHPGRTLAEGLVRVEVPASDGKSEYAAIADARGLSSLVQMGVLEVHLWGALASDAEHPDRLVFDLDPAEGLDFAASVVGAQALRQLLLELGLKSWVKTSGGKGLHVTVPIVPQAGWDESKAFCRAIAEELTRREPERYLATMSKAKRQGKVFIDYLRNARGATFIAPYSPRAREGAMVAMPVAWDDLSAKFKPEAFTVRSAEKYLSKRSRDPFASLLKARQKLPSVAKLGRMLAR